VETNASPDSGESLGLKAASVHLPDEPGTVPLREVLVEAREDAEAPRERDTGPAHAAPLTLPGNLPPLSLQDCQKALAWAKGQLEADWNPRGRMTEEMKRALEQVLSYLKILDERRSSLADYEWVFIEEEKVSGTPIDEDRFDDRKVDDVSAISLHAKYADVYVHSVAILDERGDPVSEYHLDPPLLLRAGVPRREVFYLYFPTPIEAVVVRYEGVEAQTRARVDVYAGISGTREYLKQAQFYLRRALTSLENGDWAEADRLLSSTARRIQKFQTRY